MLSLSFDLVSWHRYSVLPVTKPDLITAFQFCASTTTNLVIIKNEHIEDKHWKVEVQLLID